MQCRMFLPCEDNQILWPIVGLHAIDVMYDFIRCERTSELLGHHQSVLGLIPLIAGLVIEEYVLVAV